MYAGKCHLKPVARMVKQYINRTKIKQNII